MNPDKLIILYLLQLFGFSFAVTKPHNNHWQQNAEYSIDIEHCITLKKMNRNHKYTAYKHKYTE